MKLYPLCLFFLSFLIFSCSPKGSSKVSPGFGETPTSLFDSMEDDELVEIKLKTDMSAFKKQKDKPAYQTAILDFEDESVELKDWQVKIKARGNMRRQICYYPPFKINFSKKALKEAGLKKIKTTKIAMSCQNRDLYQEYILREFVAYKLYNILTENSFGAKLANLRIEDTEGKEKPIKSYAIVIENEKEMAKRLEGKIIDIKRMQAAGLSVMEYDRMCLFQYMIGNTDWHVFNLHNLKLISRPGNKLAVPVAYDFDYAGFVNTSYSVPKPGIDIKSVQQRFFQGACRSKEHYEQLLNEFKDKKEEMIKFCEGFPYFSDSSRKYTLKYLNAFFEVIESNKKTKRAILNHCDMEKK